MIIVGSINHYTNYCASFCTVIHCTDVWGNSLKNSFLKIGSVRKFQVVLQFVLFTEQKGISLHINTLQFV